MSINTYRSDIDGLRAISVLMVVFFHAGIFEVRAGFVGVDVFFVISGFLITTGIKNGLEQDKFSFIEFYKRRLWRLQPVFITLLIATLLVTTLLYHPDDYSAYVESANYAVQFRANQYFAGLETGYFAKDTSIMPLLHTWSLSIEWQWYLILPFVLWNIHKITKSEKWLFWLFPLALVMIFIPFYFIADRDNPHYYYSFLSRVFEMLIGSCLVTIGSKGTEKIHPCVKALVGVICLSFIIYAGMNGKVIKNYPNWWAIGVCLSAASLIYIGSDNSTNIISRFLSLKPLVWIGMISYSLYIWHWPVLAFMRGRTPAIITIAIALSFFLAVLSYYLIENRLRRKYTVSTWKTFLILVVIPVVCMNIMKSKVNQSEGFPERVMSQHEALISNKFNELQNKRESCWSKECEIGSNGSARKALFLGDSYANHAWGFFDVLGKDANISIKILSVADCLMLPEVVQVKHPNLDVKACNNAINLYFTKNQLSQYDYVIIAEVWSRYLTQKRLINASSDKPSVKLSEKILYHGLEKAISKIEEANSVPVIVLSAYEAAQENPYSPIQKMKDCRRKKHLKIVDSCDFIDNSKDNHEEYALLSYLSEMKNRHPNLVVIDLKKLHCFDGICRAFINDYPIYRDNSGHLTDYASYEFGKKYLKKYNNPFSNINVSIR